MASQEDSGWCEDCECRRLVRRAGINHLAHFVLTVVTCGLWLLVWGYQGFKARPWRCTACGSTMVELVD